ncbi:MAG TPA: class IV adenylate cyclase [Candidatus Paceibacterota bacterium]|jgi:adenylate cyclase class 2|nr:class IV adenylate cyclase [Candidatus Paceibacterota bacterium]
MEEFEIKFLEVNVPELEKKLLSIGAKKVREYNYSIVLFDYPDFRLDKDHSWLKLRTDGKETTVSFKKRIGVKSSDGSIPDEGMQEIEIIVDDYKKTYQIFKSMGFVIKREQEKRRIRYKKGEAVFDIDFWPQIPPYIEIESNSIENAKKAARELGFDGEKGLICSASNVYVRYGINPNEYITMNFEEFIKK